MPRALSGGVAAAFILISLFFLINTWSRQSSTPLQAPLLQPEDFYNEPVSKPPIHDTDEIVHSPGLTEAKSTICPGGGDDVVVILKTGAAESYKLPALLESVFQCIPNYFVFSDLGEEKEQLKIHDILDIIPQTVVDAHEELKFYKYMTNTIHEGGTLYDVLTSVDGMNEESVGWMLDKWKFLPMIEKAVQLRRASWYVFVEPDSYLSWPNLLEWLSMLNSTDPLYLGTPNWIDDRVYAHGGSGIVVSVTAMDMLSKSFRANPQQYYEMTSKSCCGDLVLGDAFRLVNVQFTAAFPMIQGETPTTLDYTPKHWCTPMITEHHMTGEQIVALWNLEQHHLRHVKRAILHSDIFRALVQPRLVSRMTDWNNMCRDRLVVPDRENMLSDEENYALQYEEGCKDLCVKDPPCLQYSWLQGECRLGNFLRYGKPRERLISGFLLDKIESTVQELGYCKEPEWILTDVTYG